MVHDTPLLSQILRSSCLFFGKPVETGQSALLPRSEARERPVSSGRRVSLIAGHELPNHFAVR